MNKKDDIMCKGIWYGETPNNISKEELWHDINNENDEKKKLLKIVDLLKLGDFSVKQLLIKMMNESNNYSVLNLCIRVFCSIANHSDIYNSDNLKLLSSSDDDAVNVFVTYSKQVLSYEVVPYLLALLEEWEETDVEILIRDALQNILNYQELISENASVDEIGEVFVNRRDKIDEEKYYYKSDLVFPGTLTKRLLEASAISRKFGTELREIAIPTMLSIWSGIKCPVEYYTIVDDEIMKKVFDYVKQLSKMNWEKGCKYFYGHKIQ
ncbi:Imm47 family immunity protein [Clostridium sp. JS66]|uniref:Imm47 family immunity protein n=1 Tax=Clostridium sp. JS66 TaxID=3064705 RepID=UPI00298E4E7F|nr:Imm47 family immunity protein [Clostridium sp. JS66]WPC42620.1 Imm47 family immunity protein [Clostridium sp. JS66]